MPMIIVRIVQFKKKTREGITTLNNRILLKTLLAALLLPVLSYSQQQGIRVDVSHHERPDDPYLPHGMRLPIPRMEEKYSEQPDDPYLPNAYGNKKLTPAYRYDHRSRSTTGGTGIITIQVNVDPSQQNIAGDAANEPSIAVNPLNEDEIVIGWRQFDNVLSNFRQAGWAYSSDGGQTWTFPGSINPGTFQSDPVLDYDNSGNFYYNSLASTSPVDWPCYIYKSTDGGISWGNGVYIGGGDKQWMTIDRSGGIGEGTLYSSWSSSTSECLPGFFTRSFDGGMSFDTCSVIPDDPFTATEAVGNNGELYIAGKSPFTAAVKVAKSYNAQDSTQGVSWPQVTTANLGGFMTLYTSINPVGLTGQVSIDVDRSNGPGRDNVYVVCSVQPYFNSDKADVMFNKSTDGGLTWNNASPVRINDDTDTTNTQWFATMSVAPNGRIDVIWLDTRNHPGSDSSALYYSYSVDQGTTWSVNEKISDSFDPHIGYPNQPKMGDYFDMISNNTGVHLAWANTLNGEQDVYYSFITPPVSAAIDENAGKPEVAVQPNPTTGPLEIFSSDKVRMEIFCTLSRKIVSTSHFDKKHAIDLSQLPAGIYFLKLIGENGSETVKKIVRN